LNFLIVEFLFSCDLFASCLLIIEHYLGCRFGHFALGAHLLDLHDQQARCDSSKKSCQKQACISRPINAAGGQASMPDSAGGLPACRNIGSRQSTSWKLVRRVSQDG
jgi:hypothetical protein